MSDCCNPEIGNAKREKCPACGSPGIVISARTLSQHVVFPLNIALPGSPARGCMNPACDVVYFTTDSGTVFTRERIRDIPWQKSRHDENLLCFCFGMTQGDILRDPDATVGFIREQTRQGLCACEARNPSGKCCLSDIRELLGNSRGILEPDHHVDEGKV